MTHAEFISIIESTYPFLGGFYVSLLGLKLVRRLFLF